MKQEDEINYYGGENNYNRLKHIEKMESYAKLDLKLKECIGVLLLLILFCLLLEWGFR